MHCRRWMIVSDEGEHHGDQDHYTVDQWHILIHQIICWLKKCNELYAQNKQQFTQTNLYVRYCTLFVTKLLSAFWGFQLKLKLTNPYSNTPNNYAREPRSYNSYINIQLFETLRLNFEKGVVDGESQMFMLFQTTFHRTETENANIEQRISVFFSS